MREAYRFGCRGRHPTGMTKAWQKVIYDIHDRIKYNTDRLPEGYNGGHGQDRLEWLK